MFAGDEVDNPAEHVAISRITHPLDHFDPTHMIQGDHCPVNKIAAGNAGCIQRPTVNGYHEAAGAKTADFYRVIVYCRTDTLDSADIDLHCRDYLGNGSNA